MSLDYDAAAVAKVMGLGFVNVEQERPGKTARQPRRKLVNVTVGYGPGGWTSPARAEAQERSSGHVVAVNAKVRSRRHFLPPSTGMITRAVEDGLPREALRHVAEALAGDDESKVAALEWKVVPKTTLERRKANLSPEESERTERIARLIVHATRALGTEAEAREFMMTPHPMLDGRSPFEEAKTDLGARRVEDILHGLQYGLAL